MIIAYVDDDFNERAYALPIFLKGFQDYNIPVHRFDFFDNAAEFLENFRRECYDLVILDIYMGGLSGVEAANAVREYSKDTRIVFCSSSNEFANESYDVNACYYIQKPVTKEAVSAMISRLDIEYYEKRRFIVLPDGQKLTLRSIVYTEYSNHQIRIHTKKGPGLKTWMSHSAFAELLAPYDFMLQCNSGTMINMYEAAEMKGDVFLMNNGDMVSVSRRRKADVKSAYRSFLLSC